MRRLFKKSFLVTLLFVLSIFLMFNGTALAEDPPVDARVQ